MGSIYRQKGRKNWMIRYYRDGARQDESSGTDVWEDARALLKKREGAVADGRPVSKDSRQLLFETAAANVVNDYRTNGKRSVDHVTRRIKLHLTPFFGGRRMLSITTADVRQFIVQRQTPITNPDGTILRPGASNAEINRELAILKRAFSLAMKDGVLDKKPYFPMLAENNVRQGFFEREQFAAVLRQLPSELRSVMEMAYWTGWRWRSEILPLQWRQIDTVAQIIRLEVGTTKNNSGRLFPYDMLPELAAVMKRQERVRNALRAKGTMSPWVFPDAEGNRLSENQYKKWHTACRLAGHPGKIPHDFRRTSVRNLVRTRTPERTAMQLTGHKTRSVFDRYDIVNEADLRAAVERLSTLPKPARRRNSATHTATHRGAVRVVSGRDGTRNP